MAERLEEIFKIVENKGGLKGRMRLAIKTGIPKSQATLMKDRPDLVEKFKRAATEILDQSIDELLVR